MKKVLIFLLFLLQFSAFAQTENDTVQLKVEVQKVSNDKGQIMLGLFDKETETFETYECCDGKVLPAKKGTVVAEFEVARGKYAIFSIHDEDNDGELNKFLGIPTEDYAISNGLIFPDWKKSLVDIQQDTTVILELR